MQKLTQLAVDRIRPDPTKRLEISDHLLPALRLVVQPSGGRSWALRTRIDGRTAKLTLGDARVLDLAKARAAARAKLIEVAEGKDPRRRKLKATTLGGVAELYLKATSEQIRPKTRIERERHLRRDWAPMAARPIAEIRKSEVAARLLEISDEAGPIAANRSRTTLHGLFEWAEDQGLIEANVVASTRRPLRKEPTRSRVLDEDQRRAVWAATEGDGAYNAIVRLALMLGQRKGEIGGMMWREVDLDRALWSLPPERTKNNLEHVVPLPRQAIEILEAQPRRGEYVFGERGDAPYSGWSRCKQRLDRRLPADMPPWVLHDLRRSAVTAMNEDLGIAPHVVEAVINHISGDAKRGVAGRYNKAQYLKERTTALQAWADHLTAEPVDNVLPLPAAAR